MEKYQQIMKSVENQKMGQLSKQALVQSVKDKGRILGVNGSMDYIRDVIPHCYAAQKDVIEGNAGVPAQLNSYHVVLIGCPGRLSPAWTPRLREYVSSGGYLVTTDWAISNCLQEVFPGFIAHGGSAGGEYDIRLAVPSHPFLEGIGLHGLVRWEVEGSSHLIAIRNDKAVTVLVDSPQMGKHHKYPAIMVTFPYGNGCVTHFISHAYLQRSNDTGNYVCAYILSNILDEACRQRFGVQVVSSETEKVMERMVVKAQEAATDGRTPSRVIIKPQTRSNRVRILGRNE